MSMSSKSISAYRSRDFLRALDGMEMGWRWDGDGMEMGSIGHVQIKPPTGFR